MTELLDERLIELLSQDARQGSEALAKRLNVSSSTVRRRISKLVNQGVRSEDSCTSTSVVGGQLMTCRAAGRTELGSSSSKQIGFV